MVAFAHQHLADADVSAPEPSETQIAAAEAQLSSLPTSRVPAWDRLGELCESRLAPDRRT